MKQVCLSLILFAASLLPATDLPGWFSRNENGRIGMGGTALSLTHLSPRWKQTSLRSAGKVRFADEAGTLTAEGAYQGAKFRETFTPAGKNKLHYDGVFSASAELPTQALFLEFQIPAGIANVSIDGGNIALPPRFDAKKWVIFNNRKVEEFSMPLPDGSVWTVTGSFVVRIQDQRRFNAGMKAPFAVRFYYAPEEGRLENFRLTADFRLERGGSAAKLPDWVRLEKSGVLKIETLPFTVVHAAPGWQWSRQSSSPGTKRTFREGVVTVFGKFGLGELRVTAEPLTPAAFRYSAQFCSDRPFPTLLLAVEFALSPRARQIEVDGRNLELRAEYDEKRWVPVNNRRVHTVTFPLDSGANLSITGDYILRIQDNRKYNLPGYSVRLYFSPSQGELTEAKFTAKFELQRLGAQPVNLAPAANMGFIDEVAGDGRGGWTDQGPANDLRMFKPGKLTVGGVDFTVVDPAGNGGRSAVVLGRKFPHEATVKLSGSGRWLFLLHALAWPGGKKAGALAVTFADGSNQEIPVENGRDVGNWWELNNFANSLIAWSAENRSSYIGLGFSQFELRRNDPVSLTFRMENPKCCWMIAAAALGEKRQPTEGLAKPTYIVENREWIKLDFLPDVVPGSPLDFSNQLDAPAGKYGAVRVSPEGNFTFERAPEKRIRFVGTNLCLSANYLPHEEADLLADRLAKTGFNAVRFHHHDGGLLRRGANDGLTFDPAELDKLDYLFAALKKRGIYLTTDIYCSRRIKAGDGIPEAVLENPAFQMKALLPISAAALRNWKEFARRWLTHRNPYTGMSWAEDPALYVVSFANENNLDFCWNTVPEIGELYRKAFPGWMAERYPGEPAGKADPAVNRRFREFLYERQHRCILDQMNFLKNELKLVALCTDLNMQNRVPLALIRNDLDVVDNHKYHDHPSFPVNLWRLPNQFYQRSAISRLGNEVPLLLFAPRLFNKPYGITEFKFCPPNRFRSEGGPMIGGYAALQGWNALYQFAWSHSREGNLRFVGGSTFNYAAEPLAQFSDRLAMFLFRRGDVAPARAAFGWSVPENLWNSDAPEAYPPEFSTLGLISRVGTIVGENAPQGVRLLTPEQAEGKAPLPDSRINALRNTLLARRIAESDTGELRLDAGRNTLAIATPRSECVTVAAGSLRADRLSIAGARVPQTVSLSTLDERPIGESGNMLLFHLTNVLPNKTRFSDERMTLLESWGEPRLLLRRDPVKVSLKLDPGVPPTVDALRFDGSTAGRVASKFENGVLSFTADPGVFPGGVMAYLLSRR